MQSKKKLPSVRDIAALRGKRVLVRSSLNVPLVDGVVRNAFRLKKILATINYLRSNGAKVIVIGHIGRDPGDTLRPVAEELQKQLPLKFVPAVIGGEVEGAIAAMKDGDVILLENLRQHKEETENDAGFAKALAAYADVYINNAFADSHREHASIVGIPAYVPTYFGFNFLHEYEALSKALTPEHPAVFILGGAKFETKLPLVEKLSAIYDTVFVGGALSNDFYKARGLETGKSLVSSIDLSRSPLLAAPHVLTPIDVTVRGPKKDRVTTPDKVKADEIILDAGPASVALLAAKIATAELILWNGPLGDYEQDFAACTEALAEVISKARGYSIVGGGDTIAAIEAADRQETFGFMSTAGGAMLAFLEEGTLPGIEVVVGK